MRWMDGIRRDVGEMGTLMDRIKSRFHATNFPYGCYCDVCDTLIKVQGEGRGSGKGEGRMSGRGRGGGGGKGRRSGSVRGRGRGKFAKHARKS